MNDKEPTPQEREEFVAPASEEVLRKRARTITFTRLTVVLAATVASLLVIAGATGAVLSFIQSRENGKAVDILQDCLTKGGTCNGQQRQSQAALIGEPAGPLNTVVVYSIACDTALPHTPDETPVKRAKLIMDCATKLLNK